MIQTVSIISYKITSLKGLKVLRVGDTLEIGIREWSSKIESGTTTGGRPQFNEWKMMDDTGKEEPREPRKENPIFTIWVHTGYAVLILSMIAWMVYMEFFM